MARIKNCPEPVRRTGGAAPKCVACSTYEDFCYRNPEDIATITRGGKYYYDIDANCVRTNERWVADDGVTELDPCSVTKVLCGGEGGLPPPPPPPEPITIIGKDCADADVPVEGLPGEVVAVVQAPGTVFTVKMCPDDKDFELACGIDPVTGHEIQTAYKIVAGEFVLIKRWDTVTGTEWTGDPADLEGCGGTKLESDALEMCDNGVEFLRWVVKKDGEPTGVVYDTDLAGQPYTVTNAATVTKGKCIAECEPTISSAAGDTLAGLLPGTSVSIQKSNCCTLKVTTSAGSFIVAKDVTGYSTGDFKCAVTVTSVEILTGTCNLADVIVTTQFSG